MERPFSDIKQRLQNNEAIVLTAQEVSRLVNKGEKLSLNDVDVVTTATRAIMSGTYAVLSFPVNSTISFRKASEVSLNGVPAHVGPCPNESLGVLDIIIFGTAHSNTKSNYGAGHLFRDMVENKNIDVTVITEKGNPFDFNIRLNDIPYARMYATRHAFKNYAAFVNCSTEPVHTIFHATTFSPGMKGATMSGCGEINPLQNDPKMDNIGIGTRALINGAEGFVIGEGTRSSPEKPNLAGVADMHDMDPALMGGFKTSAGPECIASWAIAIPVTSTSILEAVIKTDQEIPMVVNDVDKRVMIGQSSYADAWKGTDTHIKFDPDSCIGCDVCVPEKDCPLKAIHRNDEKVVLDRYMCFNCGLCTVICPGGVFTARLGTIKFSKDSVEHDIPIVLRQSDRKRAEEIADKLKDMILSGDFRLTEMVGKIYP